MKSGSVWFVYGVAVLVTFVIGVLAFSVFVLSKVFGGSAAEEKAPDTAAVQAQPVSTPTPVVRKGEAQVLEVRRVAADVRQVVVIVATPVGCVENLRAVAYAEGAGAVAVRVTQETTEGCRWVRRPVLATAKAPLGQRTVVVNGTSWTKGEGGGYRRSVRASTS